MMQRMEMSPDGFRSVAGIIKERQFTKVLLVTGYHFNESKINLIKLSPAQNFYHYTPEKDLLDFEKIKTDVSAFSFKPKLVVAVGGGRILDAAKLIIHVLGKKERPYFIAIPTTAGSGSEATPFAVVYKNMEKYSIEDPALLPDHVLLDASLLNSLPAMQRAISGIDAFSQAIESIWNKNATDFSTAKSKQALHLAFDNLVEFVNSNNYERDQAMLHAAYKAGEGIAITRTTGCHALSYYLTAVHKVPHGQAVGFFLPAFFIYNDVPGVEDRLRIIYDVLNVDNAAQAFEKVTSFMKRCGLATRFSEINMHVDIDKLLNSINQQRFSNNPAPFDRDRLKAVITHYIA